MKRIALLSEPTPGLAVYRAEETDESKDWTGFRAHESGASYRELVEKLVDLQHWLCAYCEIDIRETDRQVEHVIPRSDPLGGAARALEPDNLIACCKGGTLQTDNPMRRLDPVKHNRSCGEAKGGRVDSDFVDPRTLPVMPSLTRVYFNGRIGADVEACKRFGIFADKVEKTIRVLGLNVERLRRIREHRWNALSDKWPSELGNPRIMEAAAREELFPDKDNRLPRFFTTARSYFGACAETVLAEPPRNWI